MSKQTWRPDTCGCVFEETHGDGAGVKVSAILHKCEAHASVPDGELYATVLDGENRPKNKAMKVAMALADMKKDLADGSVDFKDGHGVRWSFSGSGKQRTLEIEPFGADVKAGTKVALAAAIVAALGAGKAAVK